METKDKFMLTIKEATLYFSIGQKKLRRMAEENIGEFAVILFVVCAQVPD